MPTWVQLIISAAAVVMAVGTLWKVILPGAKMIAEWAVIMPVLRDLAKQFGGTPGALGVLREVAAQFRTDSGSSLRDVVNRLEDASQRIEGRAKTLELRDEEDRTRAARLAAVVDALSAQIGAGASVAAAAQMVAVEGRASIQSSVDRLSPPATAAPAPATAVPGAAADPPIGGVGVGDKLVVKVEDVVKEPP